MKVGECAMEWHLYEVPKNAPFGGVGVATCACILLYQKPI
jgi:hypothetical protein